jgi:YD repeat-containing protein
LEGKDNDRQIVWSYDDPAVAYSRGRLTQVADLATVTSFTYDTLGRVTGQSFPDGESVSCSFGAINRDPTMREGVRLRSGREE